VRTDPDEWIQHPDGHRERVNNPRTLGDVWNDIVATVPAYGIDLNDFDYAGPICMTDRHRLFPQGYRWLACFTVRGCSEGHYIHVATVSTTPEEQQVIETLFLAKTFNGWATANALANALAVMLDQ